MDATKGDAVPAYFGASIKEFRESDHAFLYGKIAGATNETVEGKQGEAWKTQIVLLKDALGDIDGHVYFEYDVPRLGSRIDAAIVAESAIIPIEFKVGERKFLQDDYNQAWDYALDLKNFHEASAPHPIYPVLCATEAVAHDDKWNTPHPDGVRPPRKSNARSLRDAIISAVEQASGNKVDAYTWARSRYRPSPTIIEAARSLYARHSVEAITRSDADASNLAETSTTIESIVARARDHGEKAIVFVTGVPGAGKTLVGLQIATRHGRKDDETHAVFLSGNGPLVKVLREALVQDEARRQKESAAPRERVGEIRSRVKAFIQNVHAFRDDGIRSTEPPFEHVAIFDEAQRAWNREKTAQFMRQRKGVEGFSMSEPEFLLSYMDRHRDWAVVVCLVGGGQEIHTGEAGIGAWLQAIERKFHHWHVHISPELHDSEYAVEGTLKAFIDRHQVETNASLHLKSSMRSFRAGQVSRFVKAVLDNDADTAKATLAMFKDRYPLVLTRDRNAARRWVREQARGSERYGMVASSQAERLKAYCIDVRVDVDPVKYFLAGRDHTRSSYYLEDAATEFQTQGLELDWVCMNWDADLRRTNGEWSRHAFRGSHWTTVRNPARQQYLLNAYRVLLTRARQGMAIFVPRGRKSDRTILPEYYDETFEFLSACGIPEL